ncbi:MAG: type II toxin-antitoxin system HicB family antitoxin [Dehalococcoidia bacterium]|nr:type II toxin-antitoxin system HicB family antitoxin [Dehalococcoidia bacterium]
MSTSEKYLKYKGYTGTIEVSFEDDCLYGKVVLVKDLVAYEGSTPGELEENFKVALNEYLELCREIGKEPDRACSGSFNIRIGTDLHREAAIAAAQMRTSINQFVKTSIANELEDYRRVSNVKHEHTYVITYKHDYDVFGSWNQFGMNVQGLANFVSAKGDEKWPKPQWQEAYN